ncbi:E3 ubiquitin-protein ligase TRIM47-like [Colossoma macropomum]|uniref:E3 ubiquitin-protein ligase TRIM47-like n=1 Tax=Colossoma macropomum TaxID=42526 RepID=UPI001864E7B3|nr:E3 ubiquitin-protein ligase TRIM47-like [Colossoma macropomum]
MAEASILVGQDEFCCSVCLELLKAPATLSCGHSFCIDCINGCWDQQIGTSSCPQCRETFYPRPALRRNHMLAELVEKLRQAGPQPTAQGYATPGDVECDICPGRKHKAVKSCVVCLVSYCEAHFKPHNEYAPLKMHTVIEPSAHLHEKICPQHGKLLDVFCRTDQKCVCCLCVLDEHCGHEVVSIVDERAEKQRQLTVTQNGYKKRIQEKEDEHQELTESVASLKHSAQTAVGDTERMFRELIQSIERKCSEMTEVIRAQEKAELSRAEKHLKQVKQEIVDLKRKDDELQQLSQTEDDFRYLQIFQSYQGLNLTEDFSRIKINMLQSCEDIKISVYKLKEQVNSIKQHPDSSSQLKGQEIASRCPPSDQQPEQSSLPEPKFNSGSMSKPAAKLQFPFGSASMSKPAAKSQSPFGSLVLSKPAAEHQVPFSFGSTSKSDAKPAVGPQALFGSGSVFKSDAKSQSPFGSLSLSKPAVGPQALFGSGSVFKPAAQSESPFGSLSLSKPAVGPQALFSSGSVFKPAAESQSPFGSLSLSKPAVGPQALFGSGSVFKPAAQSESPFGSLSLSKPAAEHQVPFSFGSASKSDVESQSPFGSLSLSKPAVGPQALFSSGSVFKPAAESQSPFGSLSLSKPAVGPQALFGSGSVFKPAAQSESPFGSLSLSKPAAEH